jgi:hypothetical protein
VRSTPANVLPKGDHGPPMVDLVGLALLLGLIASGTFLMHSMEVTRSVPRVRMAALVSVVFMIGFMLWYAGVL